MKKICFNCSFFHGDRCGLGSCQDPERFKGLPPHLWPEIRWSSVACGRFVEDEGDTCGNCRHWRYVQTSEYDGIPQRIGFCCVNKEFKKHWGCEYAYMSSDGGECEHFLKRDKCCHHDRCQSEPE